MGRTDQSNTESHRVLVVDDDPDTVEVLIMMFSLLGHRPEGVVSGREAIRIARGFDPTLVAVDIGLGDLDGYQVARALRAEPSRGRYMVALTGRSDPEAVASSADAGFDRHVVKPIDLAGLRRILHEADVRRLGTRLASAAT